LIVLGSRSPTVILCWITSLKMAPSTVTATLTLLTRLRSLPWDMRRRWLIVC
jgi:hypothetical protein